MAARRGRPPKLPEASIQAVRSAVARGAPVAQVARTYGVSRRYVRDLCAGVGRLDTLELAPELEALKELPPSPARDGILGLATILATFDLRRS